MFDVFDGEMLLSLVLTTFEPFYRKPTVCRASFDLTTISERENSEYRAKSMEIMGGIGLPASRERRIFVTSARTITHGGTLRLQSMSCEHLPCG